MKRRQFFSLSGFSSLIIFSIASPLSIDMYAWSNEKSAQYNGYILGALGVMSVGVLIVTKILAKR
jgi:hypothetical protein